MERSLGYPDRFVFCQWHLEIFKFGFRALTELMPVANLALNMIHVIENVFAFVPIADIKTHFTVSALALEQNFHLTTCICLRLPEVLPV